MIDHLPVGRVLCWVCVLFFLTAAGLDAAGKGGKGGRGGAKPSAQAPVNTAVTEWQVQDSAIRYRLELERKPTHPSAGYFVHLPDGGILPASTVTTTVVMTEDGKVLPSYLLWQNSDSGFSIVFGDPGSQARTVYVYALSGKVPQPWKPDCGITPSAILCALPGRDSIAAAMGLAKLGRVDSAVHAINHGGIPKAPFSIGDNVTGRPRPGSF